MPCDNLPENGRAFRAVCEDLAYEVDPSLLDWMQTNVSWVTTMALGYVGLTTLPDPLYGPQTYMMACSKLFLGILSLQTLISDFLFSASDNLNGRLWL